VRASRSLRDNETAAPTGQRKLADVTLISRPSSADSGRFDQSAACNSCNGPISTPWRDRCFKTRRLAIKRGRSKELKGVLCRKQKPYFSTWLPVRLARHRDDRTDGRLEGSVDFGQDLIVLNNMLDDVEASMTSNWPTTGIRRASISRRTTSGPSRCQPAAFCPQS
jgi:hypothetical protein